MGECPSSALYVYEEDGRGELAVEFWDRDYPYEGNPPRVNFTAQDNRYEAVATAGLDLEQIRALHRVLGQWVDAMYESDRKVER